MSTTTDYFARPEAEIVLLLLITIGANTYYLSDRPYITEPGDAPANQPFAPVIAFEGIPQIRWAIRSVWDGRAIASYGDVKLAATNHGYLPADLLTLDLRDASVDIKLAAPRRIAPYSEAVVYASKLRIRSIEGDDNGGTVLKIGDRSPEFERKQLPRNRFTATEDVNLPLVAGVPGSAVASASYTPPGTTTSIANTTVTAEPTGGVGPYTYSWSLVSGIGAISGSSTNAACTFTHTGNAASNGTGLFRCTVTDSLAATDTMDVVVSFQHVDTTAGPPLAAGVPPTEFASCSYTRPGQCTAAVTILAVPTGGTGPYTHVWTKVSGKGQIDNVNGATIEVSNSGGASAGGTGVYRDTVTDSAGHVAAGDCTVTFSHEADSGGL